VALIITADGTWQYDDTNYTDLPIGTGTLVEAQQSYSFASEYLEIEIVKVKDIDGNWRTLDLVDDKTLEIFPLEDILLQQDFQLITIKKGIQLSYIQHQQPQM